MHGAGRLLPHARRKRLHQPLNLLRLARQPERLQESAQRLVQAHAGEVKGVHKRGAHGGVERVLRVVHLTDVRANEGAVQAGTGTEKRRYRGGVRRRRQHAELLHVRQPVLGIRVEPVCRQRQPLLQLLALPQRVPVHQRRRAVIQRRLVAAAASAVAPWRHYKRSCYSPWRRPHTSTSGASSGSGGGGSSGDGCDGDGGCAGRQRGAPRHGAHNGKQALQRQRVQRGEAGASVGDGSAAQQADEVLKQVGARDVAVEINIKLHHERRLAAELQ